MCNKPFLKHLQPVWTQRVCSSLTVFSYLQFLKTASTEPNQSAFRRSHLGSFRSNQDRNSKQKKETSFLWIYIYQLSGLKIEKKARFWYVFNLKEGFISMETVYMCIDVHKEHRSEHIYSGYEIWIELTKINAFWNWWHFLAVIFLNRLR